MHRWPASRPYVVALVIVAIASLIRIVLLTNAERGYGLFVYAIATYLAGRFGGFRSALATLILGAVITLGLRAYYQPTNDGGLNASLLRIGLYFVLGGVIAAQSRREERGRTALEQERARLEHLEERIRESQQKLLLAIQAGQLGTWEIRLDRFEVEMSDIAGAMHGYPPDTRVMPLEEIFGRMHPDDSVRARVMLEGRLRGDEKTSLTYRIVLPDGQQRMIEAVGDLYTDENNIPVRLLGVCSDVTEQRQAEHDLRKAEERFRLLAMHATVGIAQSDAEGRNFFANPKWCEVSGGTPEELRGYGWERFIHPDDKQRAIEGWQKAMASCETYTMEQCRFLHPDGEVRWAICTTVMLCDDEGKVTGQIGCALDVTEHMAAEEAVRASEAQLKAILANTTSLIFLKDLRGRYLLANPRWHDVLHKKPEEVIGKTDYEVFPREFADVFVESDETVKQSGVPHTFEEDAPQDDGIHTYLSVKFPIRDDHGVMTATGGIATDITDLKQANAALEGERNLLRNYIDVQENEKQFICYEMPKARRRWTRSSTTCGSPWTKAAA
jgi:PAS domain S-box-containing protein